MSLYTISPRLSFGDTLAAGVLARCGNDPLDLAGITLLLPNRRTRRTVREAFLRRSGGRPLMLPRLLALGDLDDDEMLFNGFQGLGSADGAVEALAPAIPPLRRRLLLSRLVMAKGDETGRPYTPDQALRLADELARLLDQVQTADCDLGRLGTLAPDRYAAHWTRIVEFLAIVAQVWPTLLEAEGCLDPADRRNRLLRAQAVGWQQVPPRGRVIAAGITGSLPAAAEVLAVVARLPGGMVVLPGLDREMDDDSWQALDDSHPQYALKTLLAVIGCERQAVADWPQTGEDDPSLADPSRVRLISEAMRPAQTTHRWRDLSTGAALPLDERATAGITRLDCPDQRQEALAIALLMRQTLQTAERTAALVTPDRDLARRVSAELARWHIRVDDSAGRPLAVTPPGAFLRLTATMVAERFAPVPLLSVLKHPLAGAGLEPAIFRDAARRLEMAVLRGVRPGPGIAGLRAALLASEAVGGDDLDGLAMLLDALERCCQDFVTLMEQGEASFADLLEAHMRLAEALAGTAAMPGPLRLWAEDAGDTAASWARDLGDTASVLDTIVPGRYPAVLDGLMTGTGVRQEFGNHPRLAILGPMEARLRHADLLILGGLNEDVWPPQTAIDPWMSRPMRGEFGLPQPEQRVGHAAHDFAALFCAPQVVLTRAEKIDGTPTVPSRWLLRLDTVLTAAGLPRLGCRAPWLSWVSRLDQPDRYDLGRRPAPCPPVALRPRKLSVTRIETWMRDPYAIYAQYILGLRALKALDEDPGAGDYGTLVHRALELFQRRYPQALPADPHAALLACGEQVFAETIARPAVWAFWWPRFERLARWVAQEETARRPLVRETHVEASGKLDLGDFLLTATADRIDLLQDGTLAILDYKTGQPPSDKEVLAGFAPQLPLEALIAQSGGFEGVPGRPVSDLQFWHLKGNTDGGEARSVKTKDKPLGELVTEALDGVRGLIRAFDDPETPYLARPHPERAPKWSDYLHLARVREWSAGEGEGE